MSEVLALFFFTSLWAAAPPSLPKTAPPAPRKGPVSLLIAGRLDLKSLKRYSYVSGKVLARDKAFTVYAGFREPVFQVVLWGAETRPSRVLIEYDPKNENVDTLEEFNRDWSAGIGSVTFASGTLDSFSRENAEHIKSYCAKLPASASCLVSVWRVPAGRLVRVDIRLNVGPPVPKALEFERKSNGA